MSTRINTNVTALQAAQNLNANSNALSGNIQRLSSGLRINSAADDPAGLAISENFKAQISGLTQASKNSNDAINEVKTAEGALNQVQNLLISVRQLAVHASNLGADSDVDLQADQTQINSAIASINRIASTTAFGNKKLLNGSATSASTTTAGTTSGTGVTIAAQGLFNSAQAGSYDTISVTAATAATETFAFANSPLDSTDTGTYSGSLIINGTQYNLNTANSSSLTDLNSAISSSGYQATIDTSNELVFTNQSTGAISSPATINVTNLQIGSSAAIDAASGATHTGTAGTVTLNGGTSTLSTTLSSDKFTNAGNITFSVNGGTHSISVTAGQTLDTVNTSLNTYGVTLAATASSLSFAGTASISVAGFSSLKVAQTATATIGAVAAGGDHFATVTPTGLTKLNTTAASNTIASGASLVFTDNGVSKTATVSAGSTFAQLNTALASADASGAVASVDGSGNLIITGAGAGHDIAVTAGTDITFADTGSTEGTASAAAGVASTTTFTQTGSATLGSVGTTTLFSGQLTVSAGGGAASTHVLTLSPGTTLAQLNTSLSSAGVTATVASGTLTFTTKGNAAQPAITPGTGFSAYNGFLPTSTTGAFANGADASLTLSNATSTLVSTSTQKSGSNSYFNFANGLVVATTVSATQQITGNVTATAGTTTSGSSLQFQLGANGGETTSLNIGSTTANLLGNGAASYTDANGTTQTVGTDSVADLNVQTFKGAQDAIAVIDKAINDLSTLRANIGAFQTNVLQSNVTSLGVASQNLSASLSTIQDTDLSTEIVDYTKNQILVQAGTSALGQANQAPQAILKLLQ